MKKQLSATLDADVMAKLERNAKKEKISKSAYVNRTLAKAMRNTK